MAVTAHFYNNGMLNFIKGNIDWENDTINVALTTSSYTPDKDTHDFFDDVTNEVSGTGYKAGGATLTNCAASIDTDNDEVELDSDNVQWASASITARYAVVYKDDAGGDAASELIGWVDFGEDKTASGGNFDITVDAEGWFKITQS